MELLLLLLLLVAVPLEHRPSGRLLDQRHRSSAGARLPSAEDARAHMFALLKQARSRSRRARCRSSSALRASSGRSSAGTRKSRLRSERPSRSWGTLSAWPTTPSCAAGSGSMWRSRRGSL
eukprot:Amastigsp_a176657_13.p5 type:complete len:121 gc:universal Amastigsp_a176657_13:104-466(+)